MREASNAMLLNRVIFIVLLLAIADFLVSCCDCADVKDVDFKRCEITATNQEYREFRWRPLVNDSAYAENYGLEVVFERRQNTCQTNSNSFFIGSATACSCDDQRSFALDSYESIEIVTINDFDSNHPAGSVISSQFTVIEHSGEEISLADYVIKNNETEVYYLFSTSEFFTLKLNSTPDSALYSRFKVVATMVDGRVLEALADSVILY